MVALAAGRHALRAARCAVLGLALASCGGSGAAPLVATVVPPPPLPAPPPVPVGAALGLVACEQGLLPASRTGDAFVPTPELAAGDALRARIVGMPIDAPAAPSAGAWVDGVVSQVAEIRWWTGRAEAAYVDAATRGELGRLAHERAADLLDDTGARLLAVTNPFPPGTAAERGLQRVLETNACLLFCRAWSHYRVVATGEPESARAAAQLRDYGEAFERGCAAPATR